MTPVISVDHLSKAYRLGMIGSAMLHEDVSRWWARMRGRPDPQLQIGARHSRRIGEQFWALDDVSFEVQEGEALGIIGRNGAGKSTLLKIMSQVTLPTSGQVKLRGRVASLLEVGTGFHPSLTRRENIFLNGAILGMTKAEIRRKFDQIVDFSECEEFIDTPVKRYSSGMYVRLAFAVAAHLEPEILIVDEVLAVGDTQFQKKCLGKMGEVAKGGRTVLFVSHSLPAVTRLCSKAIVLRDGRVCMAGEVSEAAEYYLALADAERDLTAAERTVDTVPEGQVRFVAWEVVGGSFGLPHTCRSGDSCSFRFTLVCRRRVSGLHLGFSIRSADDAILLAGHNLDNGGQPISLDPGTYLIDWSTRVPLPSGQYSLSVGAASEHEVPVRVDDWRPAQLLEVVDRWRRHLPPRFRGLIDESMVCQVRVMSEVSRRDEG